MSPKEIAATFDTASRNVSNFLKPAVKHGLLMHVGSGRATVYQLADASTGPAAERTERKAATPKKRGNAGRAAAAAKQAEKRAMPVREPEALPPPEPIAALWDDGDIALCNLDVSDDGQVILPERKAIRLYKFLHRLFGQAEAAA